jgi:hypothetical protein
MHLFPTWHGLFQVLASLGFIFEPIQRDGFYKNARSYGAKLFMFQFFIFFRDKDQDMSYHF